MPPTQTAHHPPWPWLVPQSNSEENSPVKRCSDVPAVDMEKAAFISKRLKVATAKGSEMEPPKCLNNNNNVSVVAPVTPINGDKFLEEASHLVLKNQKKIDIAKLQQGKITEYFKAQMKASSLKKDLKEMSGLRGGSQAVKLISITENMKQVKKLQGMKKVTNSPVKKVTSDTKTRKVSPATTPRKILPAPMKNPEKLTVNPINHLNGFAPTVAFTTLAFPPNLTYIHTKTPKPPDNIFIPQFAAITNEKMSTLPIVNRPLLNVIQPLQKLTTINNFNCVKLNATVVPIVKLNAMPSKINGSNVAPPMPPVNLETASPTVITAKPKATVLTSATAIVPVDCPIPPIITPAVSVTPKTQSPPPPVSPITATCTPEIPSQPPPTAEEELCKGKTPDSDSGLSSTKDFLEVSVEETITVESQKSPILSQPKTIRFPPRKEVEAPKDTRQRISETVLCLWSECNANFDTSGALLEHLQVC